MAGVEAARTFSIEYDLDKPAKKRYVEKLGMIEKDAKDPYCVAENLSSQADLTELTEVLPLVEFGDLYHYLITAPSPVTKGRSQGLEKYGWAKVFVVWMGWQCHCLSCDC